MPRRDATDRRIESYQRLGLSVGTRVVLDDVDGQRGSPAGAVDPVPVLGVQEGGGGDCDRSRRPLDPTRGQPVVKLEEASLVPAD